MTMKRIATIVLTLATVCATNAFAQQVDIQPGLWQLDMTLPGKASGGPMAGYLEMMKSQVAAMSPEQRKDIERRLAGLGVSGTELTGDGLRTKQCITKEDIAKFDLMGKKGPDTCTRTGAPMPGGVNVSMTCTQPRMKVDAVVKFQSEKAYSFDSTTTVAAPDGSMVTQKSTGTGQWLSSDCGSVKPISVNG